MRSFLCHRLLATLALSTPAFANDVLVVAETRGPGVDHTTIEAALDAALDGDIVLVRAGAYALPFPPAYHLSGKSLTLVADSSVAATGALRVTTLDATRRFSMRGFDSMGSGFALDVENCSGLIWCEDNSLTNRILIPDVHFTSFTNANNVNLLRSDFLAGGTSAVDAQLAVYDCDFVGVNIGHPSSYDPALVMAGGSLFASGSSFVSGFPGLFQDIEASNNPSIFVLDVSADDLPPHTVLPGPARSYEASATVREGEVLTLDVSAPPGDFVFIFVSATPFSAFLPTYNGALLVSPSAPPFFLGAMPPSGLLQAQFTMPSLPAGVEARVYYSQAVFLESVGATPILGPGSMVTLLDASL